MNPETIIQNEILRAIGSRDDLYIARRNVGLARDVDTGRVVKFGVAVEADLQGVLRIGPRVGLAVALEVKTPTGRQSKAQERWEAAWTRRGGFYRVVRSVADAEQALLDARAAALVEAP